MRRNFVREYIMKIKNKFQIKSSITTNSWGRDNEKISIQRKIETRHGM